MLSWRKSCASILACCLAVGAGPVSAHQTPSVTISLLGVGSQMAPVAMAWRPAAPDNTPAEPPARPPDKGGVDGLYTVTSGDTLSELAERFLGSASLWPRIYRLNSDLIQDPDLILVGWKLRIPGRAGGSDDADAGSPSPDRSRQGPPPSGASSAELESWEGGKLPPDKFIRLIGPVAQEVFRRTGVPASVTLAQAALETGWGDATIGDAKNLFGIKGSGPAGSVKVPTQEFENGRYVTVTASFRKYRSWMESVEDHAQFFKENSRYATALKYGRDADQFAREIAKAGYATDPAYANKLINLMKEFDLYRWDR